MLTICYALNAVLLILHEIESAVLIFGNMITGAATAFFALAL
ncbi:MAG: hypothetical protein WCT14_15470 [Treponemataceae bacterium]